MTVRPPSSLGNRSVTETGFDLLGHEILAEKADSLGRAGRRAEAALSRLQASDAEHPEPVKDTRAALVKQAADAVYAYFIQRELCGLRRHDDVIRTYNIPREVLARLGAR